MVELIEPRMSVRPAKVYRTYAEAQRVVDLLKANCKDCDYEVKGSLDGNRIAIYRTVEGRRECIGYIS